MSIVHTAPEAGICPAWCNDHNRYSDGSDDWHQSVPVNVKGFELYVSTGSLSGEPEVFIVKYPDDGMSLDDTEALAAAMLEAVKAARS